MTRCSALTLLTAAVLLAAAHLLTPWPILSLNVDLRRVLLVELRLPRTLLVAGYGATLGVTGAALQALFANPLASPDLAGTTSGAALGAVVTAYLFGFSAPIALSIGSVAG
ncbi:MAG: iron chelate uptake ABC transporter family permease subunit, partial [Sphingomicrobium sp.]